jgi:hypothetical protein
LSTLDNWPEIELKSVWASISAGKPEDVTASGAGASADSGVLDLEAGDLDCFLFGPSCFPLAFDGRFLFAAGLLLDAFLLVLLLILVPLLSLVTGFFVVGVFWLVLKFFKNESISMVGIIALL